MINLLLSATAGIFTGLSFNFSLCAFLVWFSLLPFLYIINKNNSRQVLFSGFIFGLAYYLTAIFWIGNVTKLGLGLLICYLCLYTIIFSQIARYFLRKSFAIITIASLWVLLEFIKENIWCGFGWANLGYSQYKNLYLIQAADLFGVKLISFLIVMVNVLLWEFISKRKFLLRKFIFVAIILSASLAYSFFKLGNLKENSSINLSLIQPNVPQELKWEESSQPDIIEKLENLILKTDKNSLVIFPEASWPLMLCDLNVSILDDFIKSSKRDILIGAITSEKGNFYNAALLFEKSGALQGIYRKMRLVPFGEYVPLRNFLKFVSVINSIGDTSRGNEPTVFSYENKNFCVLICFEDIFPLFVANFSRKADFLINITNDAWFSGEPEASQHFGIMVFRAIENRISIARCANTGISGWVSYKGDIHSLKSDNEEVDVSGVLNFNLPLNGKRSLYNKWKDVFVLFCALVLLLPLIPSKNNG
ncbi:MAG: apolipoprotein N-acyltransferase [Candidatus Omnitrophota bacterium]|jgi:apolipoprotein N-acyltransferase